jgi:deoxyribose-phosphate aldolase
MNWEHLSSNIDEIIKNKALTDDIARELISFIDLTTLEGTDNNNVVKQLIDQAKESYIKTGGKGVAAVCVYPNFASFASKELINTDIKLACVAGGFPSGQSPLHVRIAEVEHAVAHGAQEIDMVISRGAALSGDIDYVKHEILLHKKACGDAHLKVILETGELKDPDLIYNVSMIAMENGADFIKTSTGKISPAATLDAAFIMCYAIREFYALTGKKIGFKPAGGIREPQDAFNYYLIIKNILGIDWLNPTLFRIGASKLLTNLYQVLGL